MHARHDVTVATDVQDTLAVPMSPIAKEFKENPPVEVPVDPKTPVRFADLPKQADSEETLHGVPSAFFQDVGEPSTSPSIAEQGVMMPKSCHRLRRLHLRRDQLRLLLRRDQLRRRRRICSIQLRWSREKISSRSGMI